MCTYNLIKLRYDTVISKVNIANNPSQIDKFTMNIQWFPKEPIENNGSVC